MNAGQTVVILTNSSDETADYLAGRLLQHSIPTVRFNTDRVLDYLQVRYRLGQPRLTLDGTHLVPEDITTIWYRRPEELGSGEAVTPEARCAREEWSEALEGFFAHVPFPRWMNSPAANEMASRKLQQLTAAAAAGLRVPETLVTQDPADLREFYDKWNGDIIVKPLGGARVRREGAPDGVIYTSRLAAADLETLDDLPVCPTLFQQQVDKVADVRVTMVDSDVHAYKLLATDADGKQRCDIRRDNMEGVRYHRTRLPSNVFDSLRALVTAYELRFAAIDLAIAPDGEWYFFEINPNGQWAWLDLVGGAAIYESFVRSFRTGMR